METTDNQPEFGEREPFSEPFAWFETWFDAAANLEMTYPNAMTLATVSERGQPRARTVLLKAWDRDGFVFYTNYRSAKGQDMEANPKASLQVYWSALERQFRVEGGVERLTPEESDTYFHSRPRGSRIGAWASNQSEPIDSRESLMERYRQFERQFDGQEVPRPDHWGGIRLVPERFIFWRAGEHRLHDRWEFRRRDDQWSRSRLSP